MLWAQARPEGAALWAFPESPCHTTWDFLPWSHPLSAFFPFSLQRPESLGKWKHRERWFGGENVYVT